MRTVRASRTATTTALAALAAVTVLGATGCGGSEPAASSAPVPSIASVGGTATSGPGPSTTIASTAPSTPTSTSTSMSTTTTTHASPTTSPPPPTDPPDIDPGTLPQTRDKPASSGPALEARMTALVDAIAGDDPDVAMPFFFPKAAYVQVKDIADPAADYENRLVKAYKEDVGTLSSKLPKNATVRFVSSSVPPTAQWIEPGVEYNKGSYWRVYGAKVTMSVNGKAMDVPIASMISWRGQWYIVHLNSIR